MKPTVQFLVKFVKEHFQPSDILYIELRQASAMTSIKLSQHYQLGEFQEAARLAGLKVVKLSNRFFIQAKPSEKLLEK